MQYRIPWSSSPLRRYGRALSPPSSSPPSPSPDFRRHSSSSPPLPSLARRTSIRCPPSIPMLTAAAFSPSTAILQETLLLPGKGKLPATVLSALVKLFGQAKKVEPSSFTAPQGLDTLLTDGFDQEQIWGACACPSSAVACLVAGWRSR